MAVTEGEEVAVTPVVAVGAVVAVAVSAGLAAFPLPGFALPVTPSAGTELFGGAVWALARGIMAPPAVATFRTSEKTAAQAHVRPVRVLWYPRCVSDAQNRLSEN